MIQTEVRNMGVPAAMRSGSIKLKYLAMESRKAFILQLIED